MTTTVAVTVTAQIVGITSRYYVDATTGSDADTGLTPDLAWETVAKVNAVTFWPGDWVVFKRGETWSGTRLLPASSGVSGLPIVFGDYGSGALPIITSTAAVAAEVVRVADKAYLTFANLNIVTTDCDYGIKLLLGTHDVILDTCTFDGGAVNAIHITGDPATVKNFLVTGCTIINATTMGLQVLSAGTPTCIDNVIVEYCIVHDNGTSTSADHGLYFHWVSNGVIRYNTSYDNAAAGMKMNSCTGCTMHHNLSYGNSTGLTIGGDPTAAAGNNVIYDNLCYDNGGGIDVLGKATYNSFYHNTSVNPTTGQNIWLLASGGQSPSNNVFKNNVIYCDDNVGANRMPIRAESQAQVEAQTWDYNLYYWANRGLDQIVYYGSYASWAQFQAFSGSPEVHGINDNPDFVTDYTNLHLQSTSPCRNAGADLDIADDYDGVARDDTPDIGAYEYVA